jgi:hypothetical protein
MLAFQLVISSSESAIDIHLPDRWLQQISLEL